MRRVTTILLADLSRVKYATSYSRKAYRSPLKILNFMNAKMFFFVVFTLLATLPVMAETPLFISDIAMYGELSLVSCKGDNSLRLLTLDGKVEKQWLLTAPPTSLLVAGDKAYVTTFDSSTHRVVSSLVTVDLPSGKVDIVELEKHSDPTVDAISADGSKLYICNRFFDEVSEFDLQKGQISRRTKVLREPSTAILSADGKYLFVLNSLPKQRADLDYVGCDISVIDVASFEKIKDIKLENGSNALRGATLTLDGEYLLISHNLGRYTVPTSQLQQGWMNTSAVSIIDTKSLSFGGAMLVDEAERGAAGTWGIVCDDNYIYVSHSGVHEFSLIDYKAFKERYIAYKDKSTLNYDLHFLYGIRERIALVGNGPREFVVHNGKVVIPTFFSDHLNVYDTEKRTLFSAELNVGRTESEQQAGERIFNDAQYCFQNWQSCNGCHPGDARTDGLNWDLMNDGIGNPKNCKSLLYSIQTPPAMISGIRASSEHANLMGFVHIQFSQISQRDHSAVNEYVKSLKAIPSPALESGELSKKAQQGRKVFENLNCHSCHSGPYYTDLKMYVIGDDVEFENGWDTPTLCEVWRTAPYLFDGRAETLEDVFTIHKHGIDKKVSKREIEALVEYVRSL